MWAFQESLLELDPRPVTNPSRGRHWPGLRSHWGVGERRRHEQTEGGASTWEGSVEELAGLSQPR